MIAVGLEHLIGLLRAPRTCAVESDGALLPTLADGIDNAPSFDDFVGSCEEGGITKNGVAEKAFVGFGGVGTELAGVAEFHIDGLHGATSRLLGVEGKVDSFVGLQADVHGVTAEEIAEFCSLKYNVTFPIFEKITVTGGKCHPLYKFLIEKATNPEFSGKITWNFNKFLIGRNGRILARFGSRTTPEDKDLLSAIEAALKAPE